MDYLNIFFSLRAFFSGNAVFGVQFQYQIIYGIKRVVPEYFMVITLVREFNEF